MTTTTTAYTPLESLLLFQSLLAHGVEPAAFVPISNSLKNNVLIKEESSYDASRLSPESLQGLFLQLLREELKSESDNVDRTDGGRSPKKRKLTGPPLPTLQEAREHAEKLPILVERLYSRYRAHTISQIREDEKRIEELQGEIAELERREREERILQDQRRSASRAPSKNGTPAPEEPKDVKVPNGASPSPSLTQPQENIPAPQARQVSPEKPPPAPIPPSQPLWHPHVAQPPQFGHVAASGTLFKPQGSPKPPNGAQVLQAPQGVPSFPTRPIQAGVPASPQDVLQRPEAAARPKPPALLPAPSLQWEPPYQPHSTPPNPSRRSPKPLGPPPIPPTQQSRQQWSHPEPASHSSPRSSQSHPPPVASQPAPQGPPALPVFVSPMQAANQQPTTHGASIEPPDEPIGSQLPLEPASADLASNQGKIAPATYHQRHPGHPQPHQGEGEPQALVGPPPPPIPSGLGPVSQPHWQPQTAPGLAQPIAAHDMASSPSSVPAQAPEPAQATAHTDVPLQYGSPHHPPSHPVIPENITLPVMSTPTAPPRRFLNIDLPLTPYNIVTSFDLHGSGTRWKSGIATPSTPRPEIGEVPSPAFDLLSPVLQPSQLPVTSRQPTPKKAAAEYLQLSETPVPRPRGRPRKVRDMSGTPGTPSHQLRSGHIVEPSAEEPPQLADELVPAVVKNEEDTPRPTEEVGDASADESVAGRWPPSRAPKRKRKATSPIRREVRAPPAPPNQVLWTRGFSRVAKPVLDQIKSHKFANIFANPVREKVAPGYSDIVRRPQDLKSIHNALTHGNKAAMALAQGLVGGDPGTSSVWLPITEDIVPPLGIVNSAQLERELDRMFANAIMYNPDPNHGPGPAFERRRAAERDEAGDGADGGGGGGGAEGAVLGYKVDENGVVNETRAMFLEVQLLLGNLRSAEVHNSGGPPSQEPGGAPTPAPGTSASRASVGGAGDSVGGAEDEAEEHPAETEAASSTGTVKRRRLARG